MTLTFFQLILCLKAFNHKAKNRLVKSKKLKLNYQNTFRESALTVVLLTPTKPLEASNKKQSTKPKFKSILLRMELFGVGRRADLFSFYNALCFAESSG
jgi:hypothetical protein